MGKILVRRKRHTKTPRLRLKYKTVGGQKFLDSVSNPSGNLPPVVICQTEHPGFTVRQAKQPYKILSHGHHNAEKLAVRLAQRGRKKVSFWD
jgi:hypothetical protein